MSNQKPYSPKVGYDHRFKEWVSALAEETGLDRTQIMRLALLSAPYSDEFLSKALEHSGLDSIPAPAWSMDDDSMWQGPRGSEDLKKEESGSVMGVAIRVGTTRLTVR